MKKFTMNPAMKLLLVLIIALEIAFTQKIYLNVILIFGSLIYLLAKRVSFKKILLLAALAFLPAIGIFVSQLMYGRNGLHVGLVLFTRIYAYIYLGGCFTLTTNSIQLMQALEQDFHVPAKFVYGILAAVNLVPRIRYEVKVIRADGNMRGEYLTPFSPTLYFKALVTAIGWSNNLSQAMESQGFVENAPRTFLKDIKITKYDWIIFIGMLVILQILVFIKI